MCYGCPVVILISAYVSIMLSNPPLIIKQILSDKPKFQQRMESQYTLMQVVKFTMFKISNRMIHVAP
jgi:hypothetical protein